MVTRLSVTTGLPTTIAVEVAGLRFELDLRDPRALAVPHEVLALATEGDLLRHLRPGDVFIDIGANHGSYAMVASRIVGHEGFVLAIEPQRRLAINLSKWLSQTGLSRASVEECACAESNASLKLYVPVETSGSASLSPNYVAQFDAPAQNVVSRPLDEVVAQHRLDKVRLIKIDVEGAELTCLKGAHRTLRECQPIIIIEINKHSMMSFGYKPLDIVHFLTEHGYTTYSVSGSAVQNPLADIIDADGNVVVYHQLENEHRATAAP